MDEVKHHNIEAEQQVLGSLMLNNDALSDVSIEPEWFYEPTHGRILKAIQSRVLAGKVASPVVLKTDLTDDPGLAELGGPQYLARLAGAAISGRALPTYAATVRDLWVRRTMIERLTESVTEVNALGDDDGPSKALTRLERTLSEVMEIASPKPLTASWLNAQIGAIEAMQKAKQHGMAGISTGFKCLDDRTGGFAPGDMIVLAGRTSMGKTAIALELAWRAAMSRIGVFFASLEMSREQLVPRFYSSILASRGNLVPYFDIRRGALTEEQFRECVSLAKEFEWLPIEIAEKEARSTPRLRAAALRAQNVLARKGAPLGLVVIDYLQLLEDPTARSPYEAVSRASGAVKSLAMDLQVPVIVLSQLNRGVEMREPPMPKLSDLRESGKIEEDADLVLLAYRPEYYLQKQLEEAEQQGKDTVDLREMMSRARNQLAIFIPKARGGPTGMADMRISAPHNRIWEAGQKMYGREENG